MTVILVTFSVLVSGCCSFRGTPDSKGRNQKEIRTFQHVKCDETQRQRLWVGAARGTKLGYLSCWLVEGTVSDTCFQSASFLSSKGAVHMGHMHVVF